jgi:biotin carboxyl carrier protein
MAEEKVTAPIPGTVLSVKKKAGDSVNAGDVVLIIEAMKMENEIVAPRKGVIKEVRVSEGQNVKQRDLLYVIE